MTDEITPGPDLRKRIGEAIRDEATRRTIPPAWPAGPGGLGATMLEMADALLAVVQPELDRRDAEIRRHREVLDFVTDAGIKHQFQRDQLKAAIDRVRELVEAAKVALGAACTCPKCESEDWDADFEPHPSRPLAWDLDPAEVLSALDQSKADLPAVRAFAAERDPRGED